MANKYEGGQVRGQGEDSPVAALDPHTVKSLIKKDGLVTFPPGTTVQLGLADKYGEVIDGEIVTLDREVDVKLYQPIPRTAVGTMLKALRLSPPPPVTWGDRIVFELDSFDRRLAEEWGRRRFRALAELPETSPLRPPLRDDRLPGAIYGPLEIFDTELSQAFANRHIGIVDHALGVHWAEESRIRRIKPVLMTSIKPRRARQG